MVVVVLLSCITSLPSLRSLSSSSSSLPLLLHLSISSRLAVCLWTTFLLDASTSRLVDVPREHLLVFLLALLLEVVPVLAIFLREVSLTLLLDGRGGLVAIIECLLAVLAALAAEEDEGVLGTLDVVLVALLWPALVIADGRSATAMRDGGGGRGGGGGEERGGLGADGGRGREGALGRRRGGHGLEVGLEGRTRRRGKGRVMLREGEGARRRGKDGYCRGEWFVCRRDNFEC